ncbi:MAG: transporter [Verrucomicrobiales bacterium]|nr:transporter [Verrucomicrobiales bacterium]
MKTQTRSVILIAAITAASCLVQAQPSAHYVPGVEGIKAGTLPPPGIYVRDYNVFYYADRLNDADGDKIATADPEVFIYANVLRAIWITDQKLLGGFVGVDALIPITYKSIEMNTPGGTFDDSTLGVGDFFAEATLSWHTDQYDAAIGYGVFVPTGDFSANNPTRAGLGYWTHMITVGGTWYAGENRQWSVSVLNRYEINHKQDDTDVTPGQAYTLEWGIGYAASKTIEVGLVGYYQQQLTKDGNSTNDTKDKVVAIGPEVSMFCPKLGLFTSLRYNYEIIAEDRLQGHTIAITLTKPL